MSVCLFFKLSLPTTTGVDACPRLLFKYDGKRARDVDLTCRCHLSSIMSDSIFNEAEGNLTFFYYHYYFFLFLNKRSGSTVYCKL